MLLFSKFLAFLIKSGLLFTSGLITFRTMFSLLNPPSHSTPVIQTYEGPVQGKTAFSRNNTEYWAFLSIPYALPPVNSLRFQPPIPVKRWYDVKKVVEYPPACLQFESMVRMRSSGQEDCLYLNVFVNPSQTRARKPVIIYIHGGGFFNGETNLYHPDYFMDHSIVLVTFNYRLGPFGFLNFGEKSDPKQRYPRGNMGLKDQNLVLQWVRRNIAQFGGDPFAVTLMGQSAGAASAHLHMMSSLSQGLFQRAILFSGSALSPWAFTSNSRSLATKYAQRLGCPTENVTRMFECYMAYNGKKMVGQFQYAWTDPLHEKDLFLPSVEPMVTDDTFLVQSPQAALRSGSVSPIPIIVGVMSGDGSIRSARLQRTPEMISKLDKNWNQLIGRVLFQEEPILKPRIAEELKKVYFGSNNYSSTLSQRYTTKFLQNLTKLTSDVLFNEPIHRTAVEHSQVAPTYMMYFNYRSALLPASYSYYRSVRLQDRDMSDTSLLIGMFKDWIKEHYLGQPGGHAYGVGHGEEIYQLWNVHGLSRWLSEGDLKFSQAFVRAIVDFSKGETPMTFQGVSWPAVALGVSRTSASSIVPFMEINKVGRARLTEEPFADRVELISHLLTEQ